MEKVQSCTGILISIAVAVAFFFFTPMVTSLIRVCCRCSFLHLFTSIVISSCLLERINCNLYVLMHQSFSPLPILQLFEPREEAVFQANWQMPQLGVGLNNVCTRAPIPSFLISFLIFLKN